jgi:hypothetical protein
MTARHRQVGTRSPILSRKYRCLSRLSSVPLKGGYGSLLVVQQGETVPGTQVCQLSGHLCAPQTLLTILSQELFHRQIFDAEAFACRVAGS